MPPTLRLLCAALLCVLAAPGCRCGSRSDAGPPDGGDGLDAAADAGPGCDPAVTLADFLPPVPAPSGAAPLATAGMVTAGNASDELIGGAAATAMIGDYFLRNDRIRAIVMRPGNFYAWGRYGGNLVDADVVRAAPDPGNDHFGKLSPFYRTGRTARFDTCTVLQDGSGGGVAAVRCTGADELLDSLNVASAVPLPLEERLVPEFPLPLQIAATYVLAPGADHVEITWTFYNTAPDPIATNLGYLVDTGGLIEVFAPKVGFGGLGFSDVLSGGDSSPYIGYQGPGVAYGIVPWNLDATGLPDPAIENAQIAISGVSVTLFRAESLLEAFNADIGAMQIAGCGALDQRLDFVVSGGDIGAAATHTVNALGIDGGSVSGTVTANGSPVPGMRVVALLDVGTVGALDDEDVPWTSYETDAAGAFGGDLPAGDWLFFTDARGYEHDPTLAAGALPLTIASGAAVVADFVVPSPATLDYTIADAATGNAIPGRVTIIGDDPTPCARRWRDCDEGDTSNPDQILNQIRNSVDGSSGTEPLVLEAGTYRVFVSRGPEWSVHDEVVTLAAGGNATVTALLERVIDTTGYIAGDFHQHAVNSPDAPVANEDRVRGYAAEGIEFFASSDHDFLTDYAPVIAALGAGALLESSIGVETTPFDYGHYNAYPLAIDAASPNNGAIDWADGDAYLNLTPDAIFVEHRARGAEVVQVNHPRSGRGGNFDTAELTFEYATGYVGDTMDPGIMDARTAIRLPSDEPIFSPSFDAFEVWNGFETADSNGDGVLEDVRADVIFYDWLRFTAFGLVYTGMATSDSHRLGLRFAGYPRTMVAVPDDGPGAIGSLEADVMATIAGTGGAARDVVLTNGPMLRVTDASGASLVGRIADGSAGPIQLFVTVESASWAPFDTLEIFAGESDDDGTLRVAGGTALIPTECLTDRSPLDPADTCALSAAATGGVPAPLGATLVPAGGGGSAERWEATATIAITAGADTFVFVRVRGSAGLFPVLPSELDLAVITPAAIVAGTATFDGTGVPALALVGPVLVDVDGNGAYDAPYGP